MATTTSTYTDEPGILSGLSHADLLTFFYFARRIPNYLLEYTPRYSNAELSGAGNAAVQMVRLSRPETDPSSMPTFAFKRHDLAGESNPEARMKRILGENAGVWKPHHPGTPKFWHSERHSLVDGTDRDVFISTTRHLPCVGIPSC